MVRNPVQFIAIILTLFGGMFAIGISGFVKAPTIFMAGGLGIIAIAICMEIESMGTYILDLLETHSNKGDEKL